MHSIVHIPIIDLFEVVRAQGKLILNFLKQEL